MGQPGQSPITVSTERTLYSLLSSSAQQSAPQPTQPVLSTAGRLDRSSRSASQPQAHHHSARAKLLTAAL